MAHRRILAAWAMFLHSKQEKSYQGTQRKLELNPTGSRTSLGPSMDPTGRLKGTHKLIRRLLGCVYHFNISHSLDHLTMLELLWNSNKVQGPSMTFMDPARLIS